MQNWIFLCEVNNEFSNHFLFMIDYRKIEYGRHEPVVKLKKEKCVVYQLANSLAAQLHCLSFPTTFMFEL